MNNETHFSRIEIGEFFVSGYENSGICCKISEGSVADWSLANFVNVETGCYGSCGPIAPVIPVENPQYRRATPKQMAYLRDLGVERPDSISIQAASRLIDQAKVAQMPSCHYCGMPARSVGFFDEPVCEGCGG